MNEQPQHISDAKAIDTELAKDQYGNLQDALYVATAELKGFRANDMIYDAVTESVKDILIASGACTEEQYYNTLAANLLEAMQNLADTGAIDISALELSEDGDEE